MAGPLGCIAHGLRLVGAPGLLAADVVNFLDALRFVGVLHLLRVRGAMLSFCEVIPLLATLFSIF